MQLPIETTLSSPVKVDSDTTSAVKMTVDTQLTSSPSSDIASCPPSPPPTPTKPMRLFLSQLKVEQSAKAKVLPPVAPKPVRRVKQAPTPKLATVVPQVEAAASGPTSIQARIAALRCKATTITTTKVSTKHESADVVVVAAAPQAKRAKPSTAVLQPVNDTFMAQWLELTGPKIKATRMVELLSSIQLRLDSNPINGNRMDCLIALAARETANNYRVRSTLINIRDLARLFDLAAPAPGRQGQRVVVTGAGPMGLLTSIMLALRGDTVDLVEKRILSKAFTRCNSLHLWEHSRAFLKELGIPAKLLEGRVSYCRCGAAC